ncbi:pilus assembly protein [Nocardioides sp. JQ2195]|uniref:TadE family type IV pilus minor pilin n=1 Tax=Nocardioides sp. JQ2195 TaxID=2592334 RepID=UPI00143EE264|nr:TadE family type IV pilus minor pilin [Nocardioides sp. JQ2195]QIX28232.1 pilus assembly protein [Nocardioides sp. JQ2195]
MTREERGAVTAETALVLPLLVAVTLAMVWMLTFGVAQMKATDAAREAARALARGESPERATGLAREVVPGADVSVDEEGDTVRVTVEARVPSPGGLLDAIGGTTHGEAVALREETSGVP